MVFETPILFLIFNRPDKTKITFERIRAIKPPVLFIAADGPRSSKKGELTLCKNTQDVILKNIDWPCRVSTLIREENLGCKIAVSSAIDWFFSNVDKGIILEDDCNPDMSFFFYCQKLLHKYENDERVMHITGSNFVSNKIDIGESYYFSKFANIWGWATWRRAWSFYDVNMPLYPLYRDKKISLQIFQDTIVSNFFDDFLHIVFNGSFNTWDLQWVFAILINNGLCIVPNKNLISNIGFGTDATHTIHDSSNVSNQPLGQITELKHPNFIFVNEEADKIYFDIVHGGKEIRFRKTLAGKFYVLGLKVKHRLKIYGDKLTKSFTNILLIYIINSL